MPGKEQIKKDVNKIISIVQRLNDDIKNVKKDINNKKNDTRSLSRSTELNDNIKNYIEVQVEKSLENINDRLDEIDKRQDNLIHKIVSISPLFDRC